MMWRDGVRQALDASDALVISPATERSNTFGDGVFETMLMNESGIFRLDFHLDRLKQGLQCLQLDTDVDDVLEDLRAVHRHCFSPSAMATNSDEASRFIVKLLVSRGHTTWGYSVASAKDVRYLLARRSGLY